MLKSLEKLRNGGIWGEDSFGFSENKAQNLADEIQAEIDKYYLPRPLFEDGEPVQIGDYVDLRREGMRCVQITGIEPWIVYGSSTSYQKEPYKRPLEPDTQEKIDADVLNEDPISYCKKYELDYVPGRNAVIVMRKHLLARQRKLDGVEQ